jgi:hypothetical protein
MASSPNHPVWLFPISEILQRLGADEMGHIGDIPVDGIPEQNTGPAALERGIITYHYWLSNKYQNPFVPALARLAGLAPDNHDLVILDEPTIYPFSWSRNDPEVWERCKAQGDNAFDPRKCHGEWQIALRHVGR